MTTLDDSNDLPPVLFREDLASEKVLRCNVRTVDRLKRSGQLPEPLPISGRPRWSREAILAWLAGGTTRR